MEPSSLGMVVSLYTSAPLAGTGRSGQATAKIVIVLHSQLTLTIIMSSDNYLMLNILSMNIIFKLNY